ncbi:MAG: hypothetical protein M0Z77_08225 [Thermoplasmatales archaeon]|jgi:hypothetical protein|nr:hypothetical protein [Candidatus Thermoplasmatota archaeon]MCL6003339.1 hypothetical protein [Candidatus Thermoplasmatota archaeon]MDA8055613.1 hypothetical protein [Thermoplasmatales archaeon]
MIVSNGCNAIRNECQHEQNYEYDGTTFGILPGQNGRKENIEGNHDKKYGICEVKLVKNYTDEKRIEKIKDDRKHYKNEEENNNNVPGGSKFVASSDLGPAFSGSHDERAVAHDKAGRKDIEYLSPVIDDAAVHITRYAVYVLIGGIIISSALVVLGLQYSFIALGVTTGLFGGMVFSAHYLEIIKEEASA